ncbi:MAG TPA: cysteine--tRNA ligase [bacterium]|nr:cysteine--tRNA ligase [bacterium]HOR57500.1 cysteine--tRNA ligase [bacterium]HPL56261.1 cysteine--tRNA ligase [bacterium]
MSKTINFFNTASRAVEEFRPIKAGEVGIYSCGPTVYDRAHIGNLRAYVFVDTLYRFLKASGYAVKWVMNITDIDDKTLQRADKEGRTLKEVTEKYSALFMSDLKALNISVVDIQFIKATEHFTEMRALVDSLLEKGYAYKASDGIYFDISKFKAYGQFANFAPNLATSKERIKNDNYDKENVSDFVLWKFDKRYPQGRPGWHIECSAMSARYLGQPFDIHTGGVDLIFPHHQNEIAQTKAATGKDLARYWLHNEHLLVGGEKMAKSKNNFYTLAEVKKRGFSPLALRLELLKAHYRSKLDFSWRSLEGSAILLTNLRRFYALSSLGKKDNSTSAEKERKYFQEFLGTLSNDLNVPEALAGVQKALNEEELGVWGASFLKKVDAVLGLGIAFTTPQAVKNALKDMDHARSGGDFTYSDKIRKELLRKGYNAENTNLGSIVFPRA